ncbi:MAG: ABC transporter permease [Candidatus Delongbacteria bacterium]|jgi:sodium transport system permease protein|nr:ABC transporter permease [Candidatus Delongbacteria bacterium]
MKKIFKFEAKQLLRDKKTIFFVFILPLIVFPLLNGVLNKVVESRMESIFEQKATVIVQRDSLAEEVLSKFNAEQDTTFLIEYVEKLGDLDSLLKEYPAAINVERDSIGVATFKVHYSAKNDKNSIKAKQISKKIYALRDSIRSERYKGIGINEYRVNEKIDSFNTSSAEEMQNSRHSMMLPVSLILILMVGTFMISNYVILGEKDNNTLESLLASGVDRRDIIFGKLGIIFLAGILMSFLEMISFAVYGHFAGIFNFGISFSTSNVFILILLIISVTTLIASISTFTSCKIKSSTAGQLLFMPIMIVYLLLTLLGTFEGVEIKRGLLFIPIINSAGIIKSVLVDKLVMLDGLIVIVVNFVYSVFVINLSSAYLNSEAILKTDSDLKDSENTYSPGMVFTLFGLLIVAYMLIGGYLQGRDIVSGLIYSQVGILGLFIAIMLKMNGVNFKEVLKLKKFNPIYLLIALFFGIFARYPISIVKEGFFYFFPIPRIIENANLLQTGLGDLSQWQLIAVIAILPAIFEEFTFRGIFLYMLEKKYSFIKASVVVGLMFGVMHLNVFTLLETALLGIILTMITLRSGSIIPAIIFHFANNAYSIILMKMIEDDIISEEKLSFLEADWLSYSASIVVFGVIAYMVQGGMPSIKNKI